MVYYTASSWDWEIQLLGIDNGRATAWLGTERAVRGNLRSLEKTFHAKLQKCLANPEPLQSKLLIPPTHRQQLQMEIPVAGSS